MIVHEREAGLDPGSRSPGQVVDPREPVRRSDPRGGLASDARGANEDDSVAHEGRFGARPELIQGHEACARDVAAGPLPGIADVDDLDFATEISSCARWASIDVIMRLL